MHLCSSGHFLLLLIERCQTDFSKIKHFNWHLRILLDKSFQLNALQPLSSSAAHSPTALEWVCDDCSEGVISINRLGLITPLLPTNRLIKCFTSSERPLASVSGDDASTQPQQQAAAFALTHSLMQASQLLESLAWQRQITTSLGILIKIAGEEEFRIRKLLFIDVHWKLELTNYKGKGINCMVLQSLQVSDMIANNSNSEI